jgi:hypothetical protein
VTATLRVALFVEGSSDVGIRRSRSWIEEIWNKHLAALVGAGGFEPVVPISKKDLVAMDRLAHRPTGSEPLDKKLQRYGAGTAFDAAIVAWDLHPEWNELGDFCRWRETVRLFECLAASQALPTGWREAAAAKAAEYAQRSSPGARVSPPHIAPGTILPLCMDPEFETLLTASEDAALRALRLASPPKGWPTSGWGIGATRRPSEDVLRLAIRSLPADSSVRRQVRGGWRDNKNEWGEFLLRGLLGDQTGRDAVHSHPICRRLAELA